MREYIEIVDKFGNKKRVEVYLRTYDEESNNYYIVYIYNDEYFVAKYDDVVGVSKLNTDLSQLEIEKIEKLLNEV